MRTEHHKNKCENIRAFECVRVSRKRSANEKRDREPTKYKWMRIIEKGVTYVELNSYNERES